MQGAAGTGLAARLLSETRDICTKQQFMFHSMWPEDHENSSLAGSLEPYNFAMAFKMIQEYRESVSILPYTASGLF